jgi:hypothetical protein
MYVWVPDETDAQVECRVDARVVDGGRLDGHAEALTERMDSEIEHSSRPAKRRARS